MVTSTRSINSTLTEIACSSWSGTHKGGVKTEQKCRLWGISEYTSNTVESTQGSTVECLWPHLKVRVVEHVQMSYIVLSHCSIDRVGRTDVGARRRHDNVFKLHHVGGTVNGVWFSPHSDVAAITARMSSTTGLLDLLESKCARNHGVFLLQLRSKKPDRALVLHPTRT